MVQKIRHFKPLYPDVLGAVTGGSRINMEKLQCALGVSSRQVFVNQPFEAVLVLQSMIDQPLNLKVAMRLPTTDKKGSVVVLDTPKSQISMTLQPGEVGVLRLPIIARPPTSPGKDFPVRIAIRFRASDKAQFVRPPGGGAPPSVIAVSGFKLQVLREITFSAHTWNESAEIITTYFDIAPRQIPGKFAMPKVQYEQLWTQEAMTKEINQAKAFIDEARLLADATHHGSSYHAFTKVIEERFAAHNMPLHPGEIMALAKIMAYTLDEAPKLEPDVVVEDTRWFIALCQVLAHDPDLMEEDRHELIAHYLFDEVLYESILMGFKILEHKIKENLGDATERVNYANRVLAWLAGRGQADLNFIYLPLAMAGLNISRLVRTSSIESAWDIVDGLSEASRGRIRLAAGETVVVFKMLEDMLNQMETTLRQQRIQRP
jgi:hypothetical protein